MIPEALTKLERELRRAAASHDYVSIERLAVAFGDAARLEIGKVPPGDPAVAEIARHVLNVLECSRILTLIGRARTAGELRSLSCLRRYIPRPRQRNPRLRLHV
jgi:hypothetical protein